MTIRRSAFPEVLDNVLTALAGGVAAESHPFPPPGAEGPPFAHELQRPPAASVVSVHGSRDGASRLFRRDLDVRLSPDGTRLEWLEGAELPDPGTVVEVNYLPSGASTEVTDLQIGSVVRTLAESVGLEIARLYAQLEEVYRAGFVDTASGGALDNVVALLGISRVAGGLASGEVEFSRATGTSGAITLPAGTRVLTEDGNVEYETTASVTLAPGQNVVRVVARDLEANDPLPAGALTVMAVPAAGIGAVTNPAPTALSAQDETDGELRERAKSFLHGSERATLGALRHAIDRQRISADVEELSTPGVIEITPHADELPPELQQRLLTAIEDARPAGVQVRLAAALPPRRVDLELRLATVSGLLESDLRAVQRGVRSGIEDYFSRLPVRSPGSLNRIVGLVMAIPGIEDVRVLSASVGGADVLDRERGELLIAGEPTVLGELHLADPALATRLAVTVTHPAAADPPDVPALGAGLSAALAELNALNESEPSSEADRTRRIAGYARLHFATALPGRPAGTLAAFDALAEAGTAPVPPASGPLAAYDVRYVVTAESGIARILQAPGDSYTPTPFERLALAGVEVQARS